MKIEKEIKHQIIQWELNGVTDWEIIERLEDVGLKITEKDLRQIEKEVGER